MRYLVLTDIHANLEALGACLAEATWRGYDRALVLGDLVGYGADPNAVIARIQALNPVAIVRGNHDRVACGLEQAEGFNAVAKAAVQWTLGVLTPAHRDWLASLPQGPTMVDDAIEICHGSPFDEDAYIFDELDAVHALKASVRALCLFGHTHCPAVFQLSEGKFDDLRAAGEADTPVPLREAAKYLVNPGSVGQPRDGDPRAAYAIADTGARRVELFRIEYAVNDAQAKVLKAGLPEVLAQRLGVGR
ncbi:MAG: metallophosphoesterase [Acidobacteria bacterium]|nr:MAG: metallophosphoesterase [Acidobacteriota bacterium]